MSDLKVVVFDLDGVVANSGGSVHQESWRELFEDVLGIEGFTTDEYETHVSGRQRDDGLSTYLRVRGKRDGRDELRRMAEDPEQITKLTAIKQERVQRLLDDPDFIIPRFEDTTRFIKDLRANGIMTTIASASANTPRVLEKIGITDLFDALAYGKTATVNGRSIVLGSKPKPDVFSASRTMVGAKASEAVGVEDAGEGVRAIRADGMMSVGIERGGRPNVDLRLSEPDVFLTTFDGFSVDMLLQRFREYSAKS